MSLFDEIGSQVDAEIQSQKELLVKERAYGKANQMEQDITRLQEELSTKRTDLAAFQEELETRYNQAPEEQPQG